MVVDDDVVVDDVVAVVDDVVVIVTSVVKFFFFPFSASKSRFANLPVLFLFLHGVASSLHRTFGFVRQRQWTRLVPVLRQRLTTTHFQLVQRLQIYPRYETVTSQ